MKEKNLLLLGDALIGHPAGQLSMLPDEKYADKVLAFKALQGTLPKRCGILDVILAGDGDSILSEAQDTLNAFFA